MLHIDSLLLEAFYNENKDFFINARIQKIQQPTRREVILQLRNKTETRKLYININPDFYHLCFMNKENEIRRNIEIPKQPPMFCMLLRKHMEGARILNISKPDFERIIELTFENYNELGDRIEECLSIELMGKHSNIVLYNTDNNIIIGCAHNIGAEKSKERELAGGLPYIYPPKQNKKNLLQTRYDWFLSALKKSEDSLKKTISERYFSLSQAVVEELCIKINISPELPAKNIQDKDSQLLFVTLHEFLDNKEKIYTVDKNYSKYSCLTQLDRKYTSINELIDDYFSYNIEKTFVNNLKTNLKTKINKELKKLRNTHQNQQKQIDKKDKAKLYMTKGNLLTANAYQIQSGEKSVMLKDYETDSMIEISLDENLSPIENAKRYFGLYNKNKKAYLIAQEMIINTEEEIKYLQQLLYDVDVSNNISELKDILAEIEPQTQMQNNKNKNKKEEMYSKISSPNDLWFHTLNTPGSHVILKAQKNQAQIPDNVILKTAKLAKEYSTAKNSTKVPVVYTMRKYIKRPNNTKAGFVVYKNETEIVAD